MKIVRLQAENIKKIKAIDITPKGNTVIVSGRNSQGKTSTLDSIWYALGGGKSIPDKPIRAGETKAQIKLDLGDYEVKRTFTEKGTYLEVTNKEGATFKSPQDLLDKLLGAYTFDPLEFARQEQKRQKETLLGMVDLEVDIDALDAERKQIYEERTLVNKQAQQIEGQIKGLPEPEEGLPDGEVSSHIIIEEIQEATEQINDLRYQQIELKKKENGLSEKKDLVSTLKTHLEATLKETERLKKQIKEGEITIKQAKKEIESETVRLDGVFVPDLNELNQKLGEVEGINRKVRDAQKRKALKAEHTKTKKEADTLTARITEIDKTKSNALGTAKFPIDGLGFDELGVTYQGIPFSQASDSEKLKISLAIAMALNPKLRVIRITDGSLLDTDNMKLIDSLAEEKDYQIWIEKIIDEEGVGILIEDGSVKEK